MIKKNENVNLLEQKLSQKLVLSATPLLLLIFMYITVQKMFYC
jgi:hypothetical protein